MKIEFFATRSLARAAANELNGQFKDFGKDSPQGNRWAVEVPEVSQTMAQAVERYNNSDTWDLLEDASTIESQRPGIIGEQVLKTPNNKPVRVSWRRSMTAVRLANHLAKVS